MKALSLLLVIFIVSGCESLGYYAHVSKGQLDMMWGRQDIEQLIKEDETPVQLKQQLQTIKAIRQYSVDVLALPDNGSYLSYIDIGRPYAVWNVFAANELESTAKQWCFPVAGCVSYRGYFKQELAEQYAQGLKVQGYDIYVAGVPAYSTLGWFDDPSLSSFVYWQDWRLAALIFHELAHQQLYLAGDTAFSESFAKAVESLAVSQWLRDSGQLIQLEQYRRFTSMNTEFSQGLLQLRKDLAELYQRPLSNEAKRVKKQQLITRYQTEVYQQFKRKWQSHIYDRWVEEGINNAKLLTISSYYQWQTAFEHLYQQQSGDWRAFYHQVKQLSQLPRLQREQLLRELQ